MPQYDPRYDMPPRVDRFMSKHPAMTALIIIVILSGAMALMGYIA